jgi:predicted lipoprotein with Yx(FWY)xxD motif
MRKSRWAAAAGAGSLALLLTACGSTSSTTAASTQAPQSSGASSSSTSQSSASSPASSPATAPTGQKTAPSSQKATTSAPATSAQPQASSTLGTIPLGTTVMIAQSSKLGYVLAEANGQVVYTYAHDTKGGTPTCTGSCASTWLPVTGVPMAANGEHFPGTFGLVTRSDGTKQITYNGYPLYTFKGAAPLTTHAVSGVWNVVLLSAADLG